MYWLFRTTTPSQSEIFSVIVALLSYVLAFQAAPEATSGAAPKALKHAIEHHHTNPGPLLGILGTWGSYSRVVNLGSKVGLGSQRSVEIKMSNLTLTMQKLNTYKKY